ncbi:MAG: hypothetical protein ACXWLH_00640 [Candidatus Saccharimonadales bacterium]
MTKKTFKLLFNSFVKELPEVPFQSITLGGAMFTISQDANVIVVALQYIASFMLVVSIIGASGCFIFAFCWEMIVAVNGFKVTLSSWLAGWGFRLLLAVLVIGLLMKFVLGM